MPIVRNFFTTLAISVLLSCSASAWDTAKPISTFESDIRINQDGSALVLESYQFSSPPGSFTRDVVAEVPVGFANRTYLIDIASVDDERGYSVPYRVRRSSDVLSIQIPRLEGTGLAIVYRVRNAVRFGNENDEFLWVANNAASSTETAGFQVTLPDAIAGQIRAQTFLRESALRSRTKLWSYNGQVMTTTAANSVEAIAPGALEPGVAVVMHISVPSGILVEPGILTRTEWFLQSNPIVFLPIFVFAVMYVVWRVKRQKTDPRQSVVPSYEPPEGLTPAEVGTLVDDRVDARDVTSTLIDLAVRGYVKLEKTTPEHGSYGTREDYIVRLLKPKEQWIGLKPHETTMMFHTFYGGQWTQLSSLRRRFPDIVPYMKTSLFTTLKRAGMYRVTPEFAPAWNQGVLVILFLIAWGASNIPWSSIGPLELSSTVVIISLIASAVIVFLLGRKSSPKTLRGMKTFVSIRGFEEFLKTVEGDRLKRMEPDLFEKYLPYAMALGIEHRWTSAFEGIAVKTPEWFEVADTAFSTVAFGHQLESALIESLLSVPRGRMASPVAEAFGRIAGMGAGMGE